jgi:tRNA dimethylallyltransferase
MDEIPEVPEVIRMEVNSLYQQNGLKWLQEQIEKLDPQFYSVGEIKNPHRLMRALEVFKATGKSILDFRKGVKEERDFDIVKIVLQLPKEELHRNIENRVDKMVEAGLVEEVRSFIPYQHLKALQTVGYKELFDYFNGSSSLTDAVALIKRNTKQYAKRQMTWFRKDEAYQWLQPETNQVLEHLKILH